MNGRSARPQKPVAVSRKDCSMNSAPVSIPKLRLALAALALISLSACGSTGPKGRPGETPVTEQVDRLQLKACAAPLDLMGPAEPEPEVPEPRNPAAGLLPDELYEYAQAALEWGTRGWAKQQAWQERERTLGACVKVG